VDTEPERLPVELVPHRAEWAQMARDEAQRLCDTIGQSIVVEIHHIGSTSIPGIHAKPTIDLMPLVTNLSALDTREAAVCALGYEWRGEFGLPSRRFITRMSEDRRKRLFNVHCFEASMPDVDRHLAFRDYMRAHPDRAKAYEAEKFRARDVQPDDTLAYSQEKSAWIKAAEQEALTWYRAQIKSPARRAP
jgi:GrpB-like predicted nucleotidyltransferase (UPF0157 family)